MLPASEAAMATFVSGSTGRQVSTGRVFRRAFSTIEHNLLVAMFFPFLLQILPTILLVAVGTFFIPRDSWSSFGRVAVYGAIAGYILVQWATAMMAQGAVVHAVLAENNFGRATLTECAAASASLALPLLGLSILASFGVGLGLIFLLIPGQLLSILWSVAAPAMVDERLGVKEALQRSALLTEGARWKIFGVQITLFGLSVLLNQGIRAMTGAANFVGATASVAFGGISPLSFLVCTVMSTLFCALSSLTCASLFIELREWKEGPRTDGLAEVFA